MNIYENNQGRKIVSRKGNDGKYHTISYARYLVEKTLGRKLKKDEEVHHIDGDKTNDDILNLMVINSTEHRKLHNIKYEDTVEKCCICGKEFIVTAKQHRNKHQERNRKPNSKDLYFCSKKCVGIYGKRKQEQQREKSFD